LQCHVNIQPVKPQGVRLGNVSEIYRIIQISDNKQSWEYEDRPRKALGPPLLVTADK